MPDYNDQDDILKISGCPCDIDSSYFEKIFLPQLRMRYPDVFGQGQKRASISQKRASRKSLGSSLQPGAASAEAWGKARGHKFWTFARVVRSVQVLPPESAEAEKAREEEARMTASIAADKHQRAQEDTSRLESGASTLENSRLQEVNLVDVLLDLTYYKVSACSSLSSAPPLP